MSELEKIKKEWENEGLSQFEIGKNLQTLKKIYIGQNIRSEGILYSSFINEEIQVKNLLEKDLIKENHWYRHKLYLTTDRGGQIAKEILYYELEAKKDKLRQILDNIPKNLLKFLLFEYFAKSFRFPLGSPRYFTFEWRDAILSDSRTIIASNKILSELEKMGFCVRTPYYVSTRGGELREVCYVISPEIQERLLTIKSELKGLEVPIKKKCIIFYFLTNKVLHLLRPPESKNDEYINQVRQEYWNRLESMSLTEEDIKPLVDEMYKKGITTEYRGLFAKDLPFEIIDEDRYRAYLKRVLIDPVLSYLFEEHGEQIVVNEKNKIKEELEASKTKEKLPPGVISKEELLNFFDELGEFERKIRNFIVSKLGKDLKQCKNKKLIERLKERKKEEELLIGSSGPLIDYATIEEYAVIITSSWDVFKEYFNEKEEVTIPLKLINIYARRPIAHFRALTKTRIERARVEMKKFLEKIEG